jgi:hypothetical protein
MAKSESLPYDIGDRVSVVFYRDSMPVVVAAEVISLVPFMLRTDNPTAGQLAKIRRALIVRQDGDRVWRVEAEVTDALPEVDSWVYSMSTTRWSEINRRRHPRYPCDIPVVVRTIQESDGELIHQEVAGRVIDVSLCGARVNIDAHLQPGSLAEIKLILASNRLARILAITAFTKPFQDQTGFEFVDFVGPALSQLHDYLTEQAA